MCSFDIKSLTNQARRLVEELLTVVSLKKGDIIVLGCSTSEVLGEKIGTASSMEVAEAILAGIMPQLESKQLFLAVQGCEHINRALVVEAECADKYGLEIVNVIPHIKAGGGMATSAYKAFKHPVMVEEVAAKAGIDIGGTLIGMHIKRVAVPVKSNLKQIGHAQISMAYSRPKYIGGPRAMYSLEFIQDKH